MKRKILLLALLILVITLPACSGESSTDSSGGSNRVEAQRENAEKVTLPITVVNNTGIDIYELYASVVETDEWEEDILGDGILYAGESFLIEFTYGEDQTRWDFAIVDAYDEMLSFYDLDFSDCNSSGATLYLEYENGNAYATLE